MEYIVVAGILLPGVLAIVVEYQHKKGRLSLQATWRTALAGVAVSAIGMTTAIWWLGGGDWREGMLVGLGSFLAMLLLAELAWMSAGRSMLRIVFARSSEESIDA